jgi:hypothetical protein
MPDLSKKIPCAAYASMGVLLSLFAITSQAQTITFEKLPNGNDPVDNLQLPLNTVFQIGLTGLSFGYDIDGDKIPDQGVVIEQRGNVDDELGCAAYTNAYNGNLANLRTDEDATVSGEGGQWLVRQKKICPDDVDPAGNSIDQTISYLLKSGESTPTKIFNVDFIVTYTGVLPVNMAGQFWDLDNGEAFDVKAYSEAGNQIGPTQTVGPYCTDPNGTTNSGLACKGADRDGLPAIFTFADLDTPVKRLIISFNSTDSSAGLAFDNFAATSAVVDLTNALNPDDDDSDGIPDAQDNCQLVDNPDQSDADQDDVGNVCDLICPVTPQGSVGIDTDPFSPTYGCAVAEDPNDDDGDGIDDTADNCPLVSNADQANGDGDSLGDACDEAPVPMFSPAWTLALVSLLGALGLWRSRRPPRSRKTERRQ